MQTKRCYKRGGTFLRTARHRAMMRIGAGMFNFNGRGQSSNYHHRFCRRHEADPDCASALAAPSVEVAVWLLQMFAEACNRGACGGAADGVALHVATESPSLLANLVQLSVATPNLPMLAAVAPAQVRTTSGPNYICISSHRRPG
jgi:hypothetical protein